jgi:hypothetical protein
VTAATNSAPSSAYRSDASAARTVAVRAVGRSRAISPKNSPGPSARSGRLVDHTWSMADVDEVLDDLETTSLGRLPTLAEDDVGVTVPSAPPR